MPKFSIKNAKITNWKERLKTEQTGKFIQEVKSHMGLYCHRKRRIIPISGRQRQVNSFGEE